jgi:hypothetical protein
VASSQLATDRVGNFEGFEGEEAKSAAVSALNTDVNDRSRILMRYYGELSRYIYDAVTSLELASIELMPVTLGKRARGITAIVSGSANTRVRAAAKQRGCTVTARANSALDKWLRGRRAW